VTSGAGGWFPLRVNCPAEVVNLIVRSAPAE
jgi:predicted MPP superfamily phosphohydrolase